MAAHAKLSASGIHKWAPCSLSPLMESMFADEDSKFSEEGTCAHAVAHVRLDNWLHDATFGQDDETKVPQYQEFFTPEFDAFVQEYVDYVKDRITQAWGEYGVNQVTVLFEQRLDFSEWVPEGFGTADVVIIVPGKIIVIDLKFGAGIRVDVQMNGQLRLYALGAYARYGMIWDLDHVEVVIHQPRMDNVCSETMPVQGVDGILRWAEEYVRPRAVLAWAALQGDTSNASFLPGEHCSKAFCKARNTCGARARWVLESTQMPFVMSDMDSLTVSQLEDAAEKAAPGVKWLAEAHRYLGEQAREGKVKLERFKLVPGRSARFISDPIAAATKLIKHGYKPGDVYQDPEVRGITVLEKLVGKANLTEILGDLLVKPVGDQVLVPKDSVAVARVKATKAFDGLDD